MPDAPIHQRFLRQFTAGGQLAGGTVGQLASIEIDVDVAAAQVSADELLGQRILDVALDGAAERPGAVRAILAGDFDDPVDDFGRQRDLAACGPSGSRSAA